MDKGEMIAYAQQLEKMMKEIQEKRELVENELNKAIEGNRLINIWGPAGTGKIMFIQDFAKQNNLSFGMIDCHLEVVEQLKKLLKVGDETNRIILIDSTVGLSIEWLNLEIPPLTTVVVSSNVPIQDIDNIHIDFKEYAYVAGM